jgi:hypothetical protein
MSSKPAHVARLVAGVVLLVLGGVALQGIAQEATPPANEGVTAFVIGDPQINVVKWGTAGTDKTLELMNNLPGTAFPEAAGGGRVGVPRGVLVLGDLVDDIKNPENWRLYKERFDVQGKGTLKFPVFEGIGNHDLDGANSGDQLSYVQKEVIERHQRRGGSFHYDARGYHYSWDWDVGEGVTVHFVQLNTFPGTAWRPVYDRPTAWNDPQHSLEFLEQDLKERVGDSGRPVILMWHYGLRGWGLEKWWLPEDLANLKKALAPYQVALILHGHEHAYARYQWEGIDVMMAPSPQKDRDTNDPASVSTPKGFVVLRLRGTRLETALRTPEGWSQTWAKTITAPERAVR